MSKRNGREGKEEGIEGDRERIKLKRNRERKRKERRLTGWRTGKKERRKERVRRKWTPPIFRRGCASDIKRHLFGFPRKIL